MRSSLVRVGFFLLSNALESLSKFFWHVEIFIGSDSSAISVFDSIFMDSCGFVATTFADSTLDNSFVFVSLWPKILGDSSSFGFLAAGTYTWAWSSDSFLLSNLVNQNITFVK